MKAFDVLVDITISKTLLIEAESMEDAREIAQKKVRENPYYHINYGDRYYLDSEVVDIEDRGDIIEYKGEKYVFNANTSYVNLHNTFEKNDTLDELDNIMQSYDHDKFIEIINTYGQHEWCHCHDFDDALDIIEHKGSLIVMSENVMGDEEYDLYEKL